MLYFRTVILDLPLNESLKCGEHVGIDMPRWAVMYYCIYAKDELSIG